MQRFRFTVAHLEDALALRKFEEETFPHAVDVFRMPQFYHLLQSPTSRVLIGRPSNSEKIAVACIGLLRHFAVPSGRIYKIGVHPGFQEKGLGGSILKAMEQFFFSEAMRKVCAEVRVGNLGSLRLFRNNGYVQTRVIPRYYADGEDAAKFWKDLPRS